MGSLSLSLLIVVALAAGCRSTTPLRIDPSGQRIFLPPDPAATVPPPITNPAGPQPFVTVSPHEIIAPVGSDVIMVASVKSAAGQTLQHQRIEWMLTPDDPATFSSVGNQSQPGAVFGQQITPGTLSQRFAVSSTSGTPQRLSRGTADPADDVQVECGQAWVAVRSATEGSSQVTALASGVPDWNGRTAIGTIHWVDAQWVFPPPAIQSAGTSGTFRTSVTRHTDNSPIVGWLVRYRILGGSTAGFSPDGAQTIEVPTDEQGRAAIEVVQQQSQSGTTRIGIQVIRPGVAGSNNSKPFVLGNGTTTMTWTAPGLGLTTTGPGVASVGANVTYRIDVSNPGDLPTQDVSVTEQVPEGMTFLSSDPPATRSGDQLQWDVGPLGPKQTRSITLRYHADQPGSFTHCAEANAGDGLTAQDCATTQVAKTQVTVDIAGPGTAVVGSTVRYEITVTNPSSVPATGLLMRDSYDIGLKHLVAKSPIERNLDDLEPGGTQKINVTFQVTQAGELCHTVEVLGGDVYAMAKTCLTATEPATAPPPADDPVPPVNPTPPVDDMPAVDEAPALNVTMTGPDQSQVDETAEFFIIVRNNGNVPLTNLEITDTYELSLDPVFATDGFTVGRDELVWKIERLEVGKSSRLQVNFQCVSPSNRACSRVTVTCNERPPLAEEACIEIVASTTPPPVAAKSQLSLSITALDEPVRKGETARYRVFVTNNGDTSEHDVRLTITLPPEMTPVPDGTRARVTADFAGQQIVFESIAEVRAGESLEFEIKAQANQAAKVRIRAEVRSDLLTEPLLKQEETEVLQE